MIKALALDNFSFPFFARTKKYTILQAKIQSPVRFWMSAGLIALNAMLLMSYIYGVNDYASSGYQIKTLQKSLAVLTEANRKINVKVSESNSMVSIQNDFLNSSFVAAGTPKFLQATQLTQR